MLEIEMNYQILERNENIAYLAVGYLVANTNKIWYTKIEREHMDFNIRCECNGVILYTKSMNFLNSNEQILKEIFMSLNEVIAKYEFRVNKKSEQIDSPTFVYESVEDGYVIYYDDQKLRGWEVERLLNDYLNAKNKMVQTIYDMNDSEKVNIHKFNVGKK